MRLEDEVEMTTLAIAILAFIAGAAVAVAVTLWLLANDGLPPPW